MRLCLGLLDNNRWQAWNRVARRSILFVAANHVCLRGKVVKVWESEPQHLASIARTCHKLNGRVHQLLCDALRIHNPVQAQRKATTGSLPNAGAVRVACSSTVRMMLVEAASEASAFSAKQPRPQDRTSATSLFGRDLNLLASQELGSILQAVCRCRPQWLAYPPPRPPTFAGDLVSQQGTGGQLEVWDSLWSASTSNAFFNNGSGILQPWTPCI